VADFILEDSVDEGGGEEGEEEREGSELHRFFIYRPPLFFLFVAKRRVQRVWPWSLSDASDGSAIHSVSCFFLCVCAVCTLVWSRWGDGVYRFMLIFRKLWSYEADDVAMAAARQVAGSWWGIQHQLLAGTSPE